MEEEARELVLKAQDLVTQAFGALRLTERSDVRDKLCNIFGLLENIARNLREGG